MCIEHEMLTHGCNVFDCPSRLQVRLHSRNTGAFITLLSALPVSPDQALHSTGFAFSSLERAGCPRRPRAFDFYGITTTEGAPSLRALCARVGWHTARAVARQRTPRRQSRQQTLLVWLRREILAETDAAGNTLNEYVFFGGKRVAVVPVSGNALYYAEDLLGSSRVIAQSNGTLCYDADFTPFGGERSYTSTCAQNYKFEGKERDTETQNDDFGAREYTWRFGRWLSADWFSVPVAVPYANLTNPQTLNLYAMVADDPESFADLDGHQSKDPGVASGDFQCSKSQAENPATACVPPGQPSTNTATVAKDTTVVKAQNKKPLTPAQIKKAFYKQHGKDFNAAVQKVFGKDASKVPTQTLANSPKLDTSKSRADLSQMKGMKEPVEGFNRPDMSQYPAGPIAARTGPSMSQATS